MDITEIGLSYAAVEIFLALSAMGLLLVGAFQKPQSQSNNGSIYYQTQQPSMKLVNFLAELCLLIALAVVILQQPQSIDTIQNGFIADAFSQFAKILILLSCILCLMTSRVWRVQEKLTQFEYPVLIIFACIGMLIMVSAHNLIMLYMGLELQSLTLYVLASIQRDNPKSSEAGLKYFVLGAVASGLILFGSSLLYGFVGSVDFQEITHALADLSPAEHAGMVFGLVFLLCGLAFKISAVPFHMWTPDVYQGAPTSVTAFFAVAPKIAAVMLLIRVMIQVFGDVSILWQDILIIISILSMVLGAFAALAQRNIKRLLAYSSIGHIGYALMGVCAGTFEGVKGILIYLSVYLFMNIGTFAIIMKMRINDKIVEDISDLSGMARNRPSIAIALLIFMLSMAGLPPLAGFFGKFYVFMAAVDAQLWTLAIVGALSSVVGAVYYLRIIKIMYFDEPALVFDTMIDRKGDVVLTLCALVTLTFLFFSGPLSEFASQATASLFLL